MVCDESAKCIKRELFEGGWALSDAPTLFARCALCLKKESSPDIEDFEATNFTATDHFVSDTYQRYMLAYLEYLLIMLGEFEARRKLRESGILEYMRGLPVKPKFVVELSEKDFEERDPRQQTLDENW